MTIKSKAISTAAASSLGTAGIITVMLMPVKSIIRRGLDRPASVEEGTLQPNESLGNNFSNTLL